MRPTLLCYAAEFISRRWEFTRKKKQKTPFELHVKYELKLDS
jgi:hypothetical protein